MALKDMFIEIVRQCRIEGKECGVGSIVSLNENDAKYVIGLGKAKKSDSKAVKIVPIEKPKPESKAAETKADKK